jgi:hypothetical protein
MAKDNLRDGRVKNWFYLENELLDREDMTIYEKTVYIVIARYVDGENKAFPSYETIAKKGSMAKVQAMRVVKSLVKKGLLKKKSRRTCDNGSTSNLYTLLNPKPKNEYGSGKNKGVSHRYPGGKPQIPRLVSPRYPNNTNIKKTNLDNVNGGGGKRVEKNSTDKAVKQKRANKGQDVKDIRKKIKKSLSKGNGNHNSVCSNNPNLEKNTDKKIKQSRNGGETQHYNEANTYKSREKEQLAKEIAEELDDSHSLGAFRIVVDKIPEQRIRIFLSIIKDTYLSGKIKKNRGAMFISLAKEYALKNNINLNFR